MVPAAARANATVTLLLAISMEIKIAAKQVKLPSKVFPPVKGTLCLPKSFPPRLARPSPKASA